MRPSEWARQRVEDTARHFPLVWVEDPYRLIVDEDLAALEKGLAERGQLVLVVRNALRLREKLEGRSPAAGRVVVIDQSQTMREPFLLPKDASPGDFRPLSAPDWKPHVQPEARLRPTVRDYLIAVTGDTDWPPDVNLFPYERLARDNPNGFTQAFDTFRRMGRPLTSDDLRVVGASTILDVDLFDAAHPLTALELAFHSQSKWDALGEYFNAEEIEAIRSRLRQLPRPVGDLFGEERDAARLAVVALRILAQHFEQPGKHLRHLAPALNAFRGCEIDGSEAPPSWFVEVEVPQFDRMVTEEFLDHLRAELNLDQHEEARKFASRECLSPRLRDMVPFDIELEITVPTERGGDLTLAQLVPQFKAVEKELTTLVDGVRPAVERLKLQPATPKSVEEILRLFVDKAFYRVDVLIGRLETLIRYIDVAVRVAVRAQKLPDDQAARWNRSASDCRDKLRDAGQLRDTLDYAFGKALERNYKDVVPDRVPATDAFYETFVTPRRRKVGTSTPRKAVILVMDSMRFDQWREMVRPLLEKEYRVEESVGFACLPSETRVSRRALFAGKSPGAVPSGAESRMFSDLLTAVHKENVSLTDLPKPPGSSLASTSLDGIHTAYVFDFIDALSHDVNWDPATFQKSLRPFLDEVRVVLKDAGRDALVFVTADHGHIRSQRGTPVPIAGSDDVGYRAAYIDNRIEGRDAAHLFQFRAETLRHGKPGWYVFPVPGFALVTPDRDRKGNRASLHYRHGGISLFEVVVPFACLTHRDSPVQVRLVPTVRGTALAGAAFPITVAISADGVLASGVELTSDEPGIEPALVSGVGTNPVSVTMKFRPTSPGRRKIKLIARLGGDPVAETEFEVDVSAAPAAPDAARTKLSKMFGDD